MANVEGIGGVFIYSLHAERLADWYSTMLGLDMEAHPEGTSFYKVFRTRDVYSSEIRENPVFAIIPAESLPEQGKRGYMLNLRVDNLDACIEQLRSFDVSIEDETLEWDGGKHAWIRDLDGNKVELYEELFLEPSSDHGGK